MEVVQLDSIKKWSELIFNLLLIQFTLVHYNLDRTPDRVSKEEEQLNEGHRRTCCIQRGLKEGHELLAVLGLVQSQDIDHRADDQVEVAFHE